MLNTGTDCTILHSRGTRCLRLGVRGVMMQRSGNYKDTTSTMVPNSINHNVNQRTSPCSGLVSFQESPIVSANISCMEEDVSHGCMLQQGIPSVGCSLCANSGNGAASSELSETATSDCMGERDADGRLDLCLKKELSAISLRVKGVPADVSIQRGCCSKWIADTT